MCIRDLLTTSDVVKIKFTTNQAHACSNIPDCAMMRCVWYVGMLTEIQPGTKNTVTVSAR